MLAAINPIRGIVSVMATAALVKDQIEADTGGVAIAKGINLFSHIRSPRVDAQS